MRSLIDNFVTCVVFIAIIFGISSFSIVEMQIMTARHIHTSVINQVQSSYYNVEFGCEAVADECPDSGTEVARRTINGQLHERFPDWYVTQEVVETTADRKDVLVTLHYKVVLPLFGLTKEGAIDGYAR